eukprot:CAMPEP_0170629734 /NCGR_PEP_ID=MMETSP0224-20130122/33532_1 /TAXON_ID=285029 /ORGANISM="Togula jolla, Strain CCCM 725" /LENGTH=89 /DNA_ID=CAMNT_0010957559 /DNA_START=432 /DNA_END=699 /DNA_ORIENTATION=+
MCLSRLMLLSNFGALLISSQGASDEAGVCDSILRSVSLAEDARADMAPISSRCCCIASRAPRVSLHASWALDRSRGNTFKAAATWTGGP